MAFRPSTDCGVGSRRIEIRRTIGMHVFVFDARAFSGRRNPSQNICRLTIQPPLYVSLAWAPHRRPHRSAFRPTPPLQPQPAAVMEILLPSLKRTVPSSPLANSARQVRKTTQSNAATGIARLVLQRPRFRHRYCFVKVRTRTTAYRGILACLHHHRISSGFEQMENVASIGIGPAETSLVWAIGTSRVASRRRDAESHARRRFTAEYKYRILREADRCTQRGELGELLRREGLRASHLAVWRRQRAEGALAGLAPKNRNAKRDPQVGLLAENLRLKKENEQLVAKLRQAELVIELQKRLSAPNCAHASA